MKLTEEVKASIAESVLSWLATTDKDGQANVSPKEMFIADGDEQILIANIASPESVRNIKGNPRVCLSFVNIFRQKGFKVKGLAQVLEPGNPDYPRKEACLRTLGGEQFTIHSIIELSVQDFSPIIAPSYKLFPDISEASQIEQAMKAYGVQSRE